MPNITSFNILESEMQKVSGKPIVLEAIWDGDTEGWYLLLYLYTTSRKFFFKRQSRHFLGEVCTSEGMETFTNGEWTIAELAKEFGKKASEKYNLTFYFPSENTDLNIPKWTEKDLAINCEDCNKLIIPSKSPYLPREICSNCNSNREQNKKIKLNEFYKDGVYGTYQINGLETTNRDVTIHYFLQTLVNQNSETEINLIEFNNEKLISLKLKLYDEIKNCLASCNNSDLQGDKRKFGAFELVNFEGKEYELEVRFNKNHSMLSSLIYKYKTFEQAESEKWTYYLHIIKGIKYRDDSFLRFIYFICKGSTTIKSLEKRYENILTETEILDTLKKLERLNCIEIKSEIIKITDSGQAIL